MKSKVSLLAILLIAITIILAACTPDASGLILSPGLGQQIADRDAGNAVTVIKEVLRTLAELTEEEKYAGLPPEIMAEIPKVNPADGEAIRNKYLCVSCHTLDGANPATMAGPTWKGLGNRAVNRVKGQSPALYIYTSITSPNAFLAEGRPDSMSSRNFKDLMTPAEIATMIEFILQHTEE